jgi:branched-chain amino acid transport system substrate-binding protein
MIRRISRRGIIRTVAAGAAASALPMPWVSRRHAIAAEPIRMGLPVAQTSAAGVADHADHWNGATLAIEEINAAGGVGGRMIEPVVVDIDILSPEGCQASFRKLIDAKVHAITCAFTLAPIPTMDVTADYKCPYLNGDTKRDATENVKANAPRFDHVFQTDPSEVHYGYTFPIFLKDMKDRGLWTPLNNGVHIVQEQIAYNQMISKACQSALKTSEFELAGITDIQFPVQDWGPVIQEIKKIGAGCVMLDHWVAAEYAAFCKQWLADPVKPGPLIYMQYGPSQPEFLQLAGAEAEGFVWSTVLGVYADEKGKAFREKYQKRFPGIMGLVYTGNAYDSVNWLKLAWEAVGDPDNFKAVCDWIRDNPYRGVCGYMDLKNPWQEAAHYPDDGNPITAKTLEEGMGQLYVQVQDVEHKIIYPDVLAESKLRPWPWA